MGVPVFPILNPLPPPSPSLPSGQCTSPKHPESCIEPGPAFFRRFKTRESFLQRPLHHLRPGNCSLLRSHGHYHLHLIHLPVCFNTCVPTRAGSASGSSTLIPLGSSTSPISGCPAHPRGSQLMGTAKPLSEGEADPSVSV